MTDPGHHGWESGLGPGGWDFAKSFAPGIDAHLDGRPSSVSDTPSMHRPRPPGRLDAGVVSRSLTDRRLVAVQSVALAVAAVVVGGLAVKVVYDGRDTWQVIVVVAAAVATVRAAIRSPRAKVGANDSFVALVSPWRTRVFAWPDVAGFETGRRLGRRVTDLRTIDGCSHRLPLAARAFAAERLDTLRPQRV